MVQNLKVIFEQFLSYRKEYTHKKLKEEKPDRSGFSFF